MSKIVGDFRLDNKIGRGSYADVFKGENMKTGQVYAVKKIQKSNLTNPKLLAGLENEIKIMREFNHDNIVRLFDSFSSERNYYLIMEMCPGGDLAKFIKTKGPMEERVACNFLAQLLDGLMFLKERKYMHRDLKPANVLLNESSDNAVLKLADFGFARYLEGASLAMTSCGSPLYMAPEILEGRSYDSRADLWSVGCIFFEMLTGRPPYNGINQADLLNNIKTKELTIPKGITMSKASVDILVKVLERDSSRRATIEQIFALTRPFAGFAARTNSAAPAGLVGDGGLTERADTTTESAGDGSGGSSSSGAGRGAHTSTPPGPSQRKISSATATAALMMAGGSNGNTGVGATIPTPINLPPQPNSGNRSNGTSPTNAGQGQVGMHPTGGVQLSPHDALGIVSTAPSSGGGGRVISGGSASSRRHSSSEDGTIIHTPPDQSYANKYVHGGNNAAVTTPQKAQHVHLQSQPSAMHQIGQAVNAYLFTNPAPGDALGSGSDGHHDAHSGDSASGSHKQRSVSADSRPGLTGPEATVATGGNFNFSSSPNGGERFTSAYLSQRRNSGRDDSQQSTLAGSSRGGVGTVARPVAGEELEDYVVVGMSSHQSADGGSGEDGDAADDYISQHDHELLTNIVRRCETYMKIVRDVTTLGDEFVYAAMQFSRSNNNNSSSNSAHDSAGNRTLSPTQLLDLFSKGSVLYIHALSIIRRCVLPSFGLMQQHDELATPNQPSAVSASVSKGYQMVLNDVRSDVDESYAQLVRRSECGQTEMKKIIEGTSGEVADMHVNVQSAETLMCQAAERNEQVAANEELLGRLVPACKLYESSKDLVDACMLTCLDQEQRKRLDYYSKQLLAKYLDCRSRADDLFMFN